MIKSIIVARSANNVIGKNNDLVWHLPADLKYFKATTMGHFIIMGRKTFESMDKPLPGRTTIVVTRNKNYRAEGCLIVNDLAAAYQIGNDHRQEEIFILGGGEIYKMAIDDADRIYLTEIKAEFEGDTYFPEINDDWKEVSRDAHPPDEKNKYPYAFVVYERKQ